MADLTQYMTEKFLKLIAEITADLGKTAYVMLTFPQNFVGKIKIIKLEN